MLAESGACLVLYLNDLTYFYLRCRFACDSLPLHNCVLLRILSILVLPAECGIASLAAVRIIETVCIVGSRRLVCTSTRWAERHPQGVCRIRKAAEPPTAAQQRVVGAEANRIVALNAVSPRAGISIPEGKRSFEIETANLKPFSWGIERGLFSFTKENSPL